MQNQKDLLKDFIAAEECKKRLKQKNTFILVFGILMFMLGFAVARFYYISAIAASI